MRLIILTIMLTFANLVGTTAPASANEDQAATDCPLGDEILCLRHALIDMSLIAATITAHVEAGRLEDGEQLAWFYGSFISLLKEPGLSTRLVTWRMENRDALDPPSPTDAVAVTLWLSDWIEASENPLNIRRISDGLTSRLDSTNPIVAKNIKEQTLNKFIILAKSVTIDNYSNDARNVGQASQYYAKTLPKKSREALSAWIQRADDLAAPLNDEISVLSEMALSAAEMGDKALADSTFSMALDRYREAIETPNLNPTVWLWSWETLARNLVQADRLEIAEQTANQVEQALAAFDVDDQSLRQRLDDFRYYLTEAKFSR